MSRPLVLSGAESLEMYSADVEASVYAKVQSAAKAVDRFDLAISEVNIRRFMAGMAIGDQGDCNSIEDIVEHAIAEDLEKTKIVAPVTT